MGVCFCWGWVGGTLKLICNWGSLPWVLCIKCTHHTLMPPIVLVNCSGSVHCWLTVQAVFSRSWCSQVREGGEQGCSISIIWYMIAHVYITCIFLLHILLVDMPWIVGSRYPVSHSYPACCRCSQGAWDWACRCIPEDAYHIYMHIVIVFYLDHGALAWSGYMESNKVVVGLANSWWKKGKKVTELFVCGSGCVVLN